MPSMERVVGIRGATRAREDTASEVLSATRELLEEMIAANKIVSSDIVSILFTVSPDLHSTYPAAAAREIGLTHVALLGAQEMDAAGGMDRVVRVLIHAYSAALPRHVFLRDARELRPDLLSEAEGRDR